MQQPAAEDHHERRRCSRDDRARLRLIDITKSTPKTVEALMALELPAGVEIEIKL